MHVLPSKTPKVPSLPDHSAVPDVDVPSEITIPGDLPHQPNTLPHTVPAVPRLGVTQQQQQQEQSEVISTAVALLAAASLAAVAYYFFNMRRRKRGYSRVPENAASKEKAASIELVPAV